MFIDTNWDATPVDVEKLRTFALPPMGTIPCVLYCNFDLFWVGEQLQVIRAAAMDAELELAHLRIICALLLQRSAARMRHWQMEETVGLLLRVADSLRVSDGWEFEGFLALIERLMVAVGRVQSAVDGLIPWETLDEKLSLRASALLVAGTEISTDG